MAVNEVTGLTGLSRDQFFEAMKDQWLPMWPQAIRLEANLLGQVKKKKGGIGIGGRRSITSLMHRLPMSAGMGRFEGDQMGTPVGQAYENLEIIERSFYAIVQYTGHVQRAARQGKTVAWAKPLVDALAGVRKRHSLVLNRMAHSGNRDILGAVSAYAAGPPGTATMYGENLRTEDPDERYHHGTRKIHEGMEVAFIAAAGGATVPGGSTHEDNTDTALARTVSAVDDATGIVTLSAPLGTTLGANADYALMIPFRSRLNVPGAEDANSDSDYAGMNGLDNLIVDASRKAFVYGVDRTTRSYVEPTVIDNGGAPQAQNEHQLTLAIHRAAEHRHANGNEVTELLTSRGVQREYIQEISGDRRFGPVINNRGWGRLAFTANGTKLPIMVDQETASGVWWGLNIPGFGWFEQMAMGMVDDAERFVSGADAHQILLVESGNLAHRSIPSNFLLGDVAYSNTALVPA